MEDSWKEYKFLDHPLLIGSLFYPRPDYYTEPDSDHMLHVDLPVGDGISISCQMYFGEKKGPCILYFHGNGELASEYGDVGAVFNSAGINLFVADYRGYGRSGGRPNVSNMLKDSHALLKGFKNALAERDFTGSHFIMGRSLGSASAIELAANYPAEFKGLIIESGFCDITDLLGHFGLSPVDAQQSGLETPGLNRVRRIAMASLIIHGEYDSIVPLAEGEKIFHNLISTDKRMVVVPNADHNSVFMEDTELYMRELGDFVKRNK